MRNSARVLFFLSRKWRVDIEQRCYWVEFGFTEFFFVKLLGIFIVYCLIGHVGPAGFLNLPPLRILKQPHRRYSGLGSRLHGRYELGAICQVSYEALHGSRTTFVHWMW